MTHSVELRAEDEAECLAGGFASAADALRFSVANSTYAFEQMMDEDLVAYWGWRELTTMGGGCLAWMLSTPAIEQYPVAAARTSRRELARLLDRYGEVLVQVDSRYLKALRWLEWLGFTILNHQGRFIHMRCVRPGSMN